MGMNWLKPNRKNRPIRYTDANRISKITPIVDTICKFVKPETNVKILEIGCNAGMILEELRKKGFLDLFGNDINPAVKPMMAKFFPALADIVDMRIGDILEVIYTYSDEYFDLIFTHGVLQHLPFSHDMVFSEIVKKIKKGGFLIVDEDETTVSSYHFNRDYNSIFTGLDMSPMLFYGRVKVFSKSIG